MHDVTYRFFDIRVIFSSYDVINTHIKRLSSVAFLFFCINSNSIIQVIKKVMLSLIRLKIGSISPFLRIFGNFKI